VEDVERIIRPVNYYRTKAGRVIEIARTVLERFGARVPATLDELVSLPGVGRKTANCVLVYGFGAEAIPVDTHVHRISNRLGWVKTGTPEQTERELWKVIPEAWVRRVNDLLVKHGQTVCRPIGPKCDRCRVGEYCAERGLGD